VTATFAATMHRLTGGRYAFGLGRGFDLLFDVMGVPRVTGAQMEDAVGIYRSLWHGRSVTGHKGPAGSYPYLHQDGSFDEDIPVLMMAIGGRTLELAGRVADGVVLHTFFTDETTARVVKTVKDSAEQAGRDPDAVKVWSCFATVGDHIAPDVALKKTVGRLATYLQGYGDLLVRTNNWDPAVLERFRADEFVSTFQGAIDRAATTAQLEHVATLIPDEWLEPMAKGSPEQCVAAVRNQFDLGCDGVILHGATPDELEPVLKAYAARA
jgi:probable F420-dependent oxidoreductase